MCSSLDTLTTNRGSQISPSSKVLARVEPMFVYYQEVTKLLGIYTLADKPCFKGAFFTLDLPVTWKQGSRYTGCHGGSVAIFACFIDPKVSD